MRERGGKDKYEYLSPLMPIIQILFCWRSAEKPDNDLYAIIKSIYVDIEAEMKLTEPFDPKVILANVDQKEYCFRRAIIESTGGGCNVFVSEDILIKQTIQQSQQIPVPQTVVKDNRQFEGWKYENLQETA